MAAEIAAPVAVDPAAALAMADAIRAQLAAQVAVQVQTAQYWSMITNIVMAGIGLLSLLITTVGGVLVLWIKLQQSKLVGVVEKLEHNTNSMHEAIVKMTRAEGVAEGTAQEKAKEKI